MAFPNSVGNFRLGKNLGAGYSGSIHRSKHIHTNQIVALKLQDVNHECPTNRYERSIYPALQGGKGMPRLYASGVQGKWDYLAIELLGSSLDGLWRETGRQVMELRTVCEMSMQMIELLETMHSRGVLHRDIQLGNTVVGLKDPHNLYMIDFGFSKFYRDPKTGRHIPDSRAKRDFIGNYWFSSVRVHCNGRVPSRRDDLEAAALMFIHVLVPNGLSWTRNGVPKTEEAHERLKRAKSSARPEDLCFGLPEEFEEFLRYCRRLRFDEEPNYKLWIERFRDLKKNIGCGDSMNFIWPPPEKATQPPRKIMPPAPPPAEMELLLGKLAMLDLSKRPRGAPPILGDQDNIAEATRAMQNAPIHEVVDISDEEEPPAAMPKENKAARLQRLVQRMERAIDNNAVADTVDEFRHVLTSYTARNLTKEGFSFLDALHKQLSDPSIYTPLRSRSELPPSAPQSTQPNGEKLGVVARLRREVLHAPDNKSVAAMVEDFGRVTNRSAGRTITKDGLLFIQGIAERLRKLA